VHFRPFYDWISEAVFPPEMIMNSEYVSSVEHETLPAPPLSGDAEHGAARRACAATAPGAEQLEQYARLLEANSDYRVLRRLLPTPPICTPGSGASTKRGVFVDVETTGLDTATDQVVVELAMLAFDYSTEGQVHAVRESFEAFRDPGRRIPPEVTALTGIGDAMVAGKSIDLVEVSDFVSKADLVIAHNAGFDRPFCERLSDAFTEKAWACSFREIAWVSEGFDSARLGHLALGHGLFFDAHRALDDCRAGLEILSRPLPRSGRTALAALLDSARRPRWRIRALGARFAARSALKTRGYRWNDGSNGAARAWFIDVGEDALEAELDFLRREIYRRPNVAVDAQRVTALDRYSDRCR
jgi:DNA polymerase III subunit epsilon